MSRGTHSTTTGDVTIEQLAARLDLSETAGVDGAALEAAELPVSRYGSEATRVAALCVACKRRDRQAVDPAALATRAGVDPIAVTDAMEALERELSPPAAPAEIRSLRRSIVALYELLACLEAGRSNAPRLSRAECDTVDPSVIALRDCPPDRLDEAKLRAHLRRLEGDLETAQLGVELSVMVQSADPKSSRNGV